MKITANQLENELDIIVTCELCGSKETFTEEDNGFDYIDLLAHSIEAGWVYGWWAVNGKSVCDICYAMLCVHPRPVDTHVCMRYAGHEGDHECCRNHMFY